MRKPNINKTTPPPTKTNRQTRLAVFLVFALIVAAAAVLWWMHSWQAAPISVAAAVLTKPESTQPPPQFVGRVVCSGCHAEQDRLWQGSYHDLAMQEANAQTVLGDFNDTVFKKDDVVSRFFRRDGKFIVNTDGPDGKLADFEVKYTFGIRPLQQYLLELPGGRLQALSISWDSRSKEQGGQHWFHLYPKEHIDHTDELHWTKLSQNWNYMCAECHSTNLQKNYDTATHTYKTTWSEINVACEACHGPGSQHVAFEQQFQPEKNLSGNSPPPAGSNTVELSSKVPSPPGGGLGWGRSKSEVSPPVGRPRSDLPLWGGGNSTASPPLTQGAGFIVGIDSKTKGLAFLLDERKGVQWPIDPATGNAHRSVSRGTAKEIETCARCHARRAQLFADYRYGQPLLETHLPSLLQDTLYHADGQIDGEVYEYGSILQSKMNKAGVTCSDCHEPHSLKVRVPGNGVCLQCHAANQYDTGKHHFHRAGSAGANCVDCHMPVKNYMVVDPRRDHSFRIPRPDLSAKLGTPNACTACHANKPASWAAAKVGQWVGHDPRGYQDYAETFHAARTGSADAEAKLLALLGEKAQPAIARATAAAVVGHRLSADALPTLVDALFDADPLVRAAAVEALAPLPPEQRWQVAHALLRDPVRGVRTLAVGALAGMPVEKIPSDERADFNKATDEYLASQNLNADEPGAQVNLGNFHAARGEPRQAEAAYREALALNPDWVPAYANLADFYRQTNHEAEGERILREGLARQPKSAALHHSLGLSLIRQKNLPAALTSLKQAAELAPDNARFTYVYAVALDSAGRKREARAVVDVGLRRMPGAVELNELRSQWVTVGQ